MILSCFTDKDHLLLFSCYGLDYYDFDSETVSFIKERTAYIEDNFIYWYTPLNFEELLQLVIQEGICYRCMVVKLENNNTTKIRFKLEGFEHYEYGEVETRALIISEEEDEDYIINIAPLINEVGEKFSGE